MVVPLTQLRAFSLATDRAETPICVTRPIQEYYKFNFIFCAFAVFFTGLSNGFAFAQNGSVSPAATSEQTEGNATGLQRIEDGSVVSNEHTAKWRIFTDNGRDSFQKARACDRKLDEAEKLFLAALLEAKEGFGLRDPHVASALNNLAEFYRLKKEYEKAELLYLEAIEILEESFGSNDIRVGTALHSLGICYHLQHKFAQAQTCYERALKIEGRVMGVGHPEYAATMYLLAKSVVSRFSKTSIDCINNEDTILQWTLAKGSKMVLVLSLQGKRNDAESLTKESIRILEVRLPFQFVGLNLLGVHASVHEDYEIDLGSWAWRVTDMYTENEISLYGKHLLRNLALEVINLLFFYESANKSKDYLCLCFVALAGYFTLSALVLAKSKRFAEAEIWLRKILHTQELTKACQYVFHVYLHMYCLFNIPSWDSDINL
ncbi:hypothetical protein HU200_032676 [Digitaria exilis]|uniref:Uncharacterized protein n=1 Tax=Digitaria exilis TaxID=1010633 RepID=A0A835BKQ4_9POAL|nr:hypothetical protein HU200_032676 [Digitaria exilis]